jgi:TPR repeat protein
MDQRELRAKAESGDRQAQYDLAKLIQDAAYLDNATFKKNLKEAFKLYRMSALQDFAPAQHEIGCMYIGGEGVREDRDKGFEWLKKAAAQGLSESEFEIADALELEDADGENSEEIFEWYKRAAEHGHVEAQFKLGECYEDGTGVPRNDSEAFCWYLNAAKLGERFAAYAVGRCYVHGQGTSKNADEALKWLSQFTDPRTSVSVWFMSRAQMLASMIFLDSQHSRVDLIEAYKWLNLAATYLPKGEEFYGVMSSEKAMQFRNELTQRMSSEQVKEAQKRAAEMFVSTKKIERRLEEERGASV